MSGQEGQVDSTSDTCSFSFLLSSTQGIWCLLNHRFSIVGLRRDPNQNKEEISLQKIWQESQAGVQQGVNLFPFAPPFFYPFLSFVSNVWSDQSDKADFSSDSPRNREQHAYRLKIMGLNDSWQGQQNKSRPVVVSSGRFDHHLQQLASLLVITSLQTNITIPGLTEKKRGRQEWEFCTR